MDIQNNLGLLGNLFAHHQILKAQTATEAQKSSAKPAYSFRSNTDIDVVHISTNSKTGTQIGNSSRLVSETIENIENGFRRIQEFETSKGRKFTRIQEITNTPNRSKRIVIQQNESGNTTILEHILDRQDNGTFRQTQRFTNEVGETDTNIQFNVISDDAKILLGLPPNPEDRKSNPFNSVRGTQYNIVV